MNKLWFSAIPALPAVAIMQESQKQTLYIRGIASPAPCGYLLGEPQEPIPDRLLTKTLLAQGIPQSRQPRQAARKLILNKVAATTAKGSPQGQNFHVLVVQNAAPNRYQIGHLKSHRPRAAWCLDQVQE